MKHLLIFFLAIASFLYSEDLAPSASYSGIAVVKTDLSEARNLGNWVNYFLDKENNKTSFSIISRREKNLLTKINADKDLMVPGIRYGSFKPELILYKSGDHFFVVSMSMGVVIEINGGEVRDGALNPNLTESLKVMWFDRVNSP